ncbi:hypothetical protein C2S51_024513 [Perilla frutescens var. frutescens]|nr:hypothetical protein C2S51_024513 [Perilla frutescens var. frutescens]
MERPQTEIPEKEESSSVDSKIDIDDRFDIPKKLKTLKKNSGSTECGEIWNLRDESEYEDESSDSEIGGIENAEGTLSEGNDMVVDQIKKSGEEINDPDDSGDHAVSSQRSLGFKAETISSAIDQKSLKHIIQTYGIACQLKVRVPKSSERACWPPRDAVAVYFDIFKKGVRLPLHNFFRKIAANYGISPAQIAPNGYSHMMGMLLIWYDLKFGEPSLEEWHPLYRIVNVPGNLGFYYFTRWTGGFTGLVRECISYSGDWKPNWFWVTCGEDSEGCHSRFFSRARFQKKHKPQGILLKRIQRALDIPQEYRSFKTLRDGRVVSAIKMPPINARTIRLTEIKARADEVKDKSSKEGSLGSAAPSGGQRPSDVPLSKKVRTSTLAPNPTPHTTPAREKPDSVVVEVGFSSSYLADGPMGPMLDELGNEIVPRNSATFDPSSIVWSKMQNEMVVVDIGNLQAAGLKSQIARALNHSVQATMALSCARANLEAESSSTSKLEAEVAALKTEVEKLKKGKAEAEKKVATTLEESETYKSRLSKVKISHAKLQKEFDPAKDHYKSELAVRDKTLDAAKKGEGIDLQKIADSEAFQPIRADMEMKIAEGLLGMIKDKNPDLDLSFLYDDDAT